MFFSKCTSTSFVEAFRRSDARLMGLHIRSVDNDQNRALGTLHRAYKVRASSYGSFYDGTLNPKT